MAIDTLNTELSAINLCLSGIGREPVESTDTPDLDASQALDMVRQVSHDIQGNRGRGWWFNRERNWRLQPDPLTGQVKVPNNALSIIQVRAHFHDANQRLVVRGDRVYDLLEHTFDLRDLSDLQGVITFDFVMLLDYELLPPVCRTAIAWRARRIFSGDTEGDTNKFQMQAEPEATALAALAGEEVRQSRKNYLNNPQAQRFLGRVRGTNSNY